MRAAKWIGGTFVMALSLLTACIHDGSECWDVSEEAQGGGAGGPIVPTGAGGYGNVPPKPQNASGPTPPGCVGIGSFSASLFKFTTTLADDGTDKGGGYQEATANNVKFVDGRQDPPAAWTCNIWVGMPLRTVGDGKISAGRAAEIAADVLTVTSSITMRNKPAWVPGAFCKQLGVDMSKSFQSLYGSVGGSARAQ